MIIKGFCSKFYKVQLLIPREQQKRALESEEEIIMKLENLVD